MSKTKRLTFTDDFKKEAVRLIGTIWIELSCLAFDPTVEGLFLL